MGLTREQIEAYNENGFVVAKGVLDASDTQPVIDELVEFIDHRAKELFEQGKITNMYAEASFEQRLGLILKDSVEIGRGMDIMDMRGPAMFNFLGNDNLLDAVQSLVGPEITCNPIQHVRAKPPSNFGHSSWSHGVPWHQDAAVMMKEAENSNVITCWLPLTLSNRDRGCLQVLSGVSQLGYLTHQKEGGTMIVPDIMPDSEPVYLECDRGDIVFLSRYTPHRSLPNLSDYCRWSLDLRYQPTGQHTGRTAHPDFVVRSLSQQDNPLIDHKAWSDLWVDAFENPRGAATHRTE